jgi:hypothetical protein
MKANRQYMVVVNCPSAGIRETFRVRTTSPDRAWKRASAIFSRRYPVVLENYFAVGCDIQRKEIKPEKYSVRVRCPELGLRRTYRVEANTHRQSWNRALARFCADFPKAANADPHVDVYGKSFFPFSREIRRLTSGFEPQPKVGFAPVA